MSRKKSGATRRVTKAERWLNLLAFLLEHRYAVSREDILSHVDDYKDDWLTRNEKTQESVRRKFERDKAELKTLGIALEPKGIKVLAGHTTSEVDGYLLRAKDFYLPYLEFGRPASQGDRPYLLPSVSLSADDLAMLRRAAERVTAFSDTSLAVAASSLIGKLSFDLPRLAEGPREQLSARVGEGFRQIFVALQEGVEERRSILCRYYSIRRDQEEDREIEPYALMLTWGQWYCIGRSSNAIRVFRLSRMRRANALTGKKARFEVPRDFSVRQYLDRAPWELSDAQPTTVRIRLAFPHSRWILAEGLGQVVQAMDQEGGVVLEFAVRAVDSFIRWLLPFGAQAEVLSPSGIAAELTRERERVRALYS